MKIGIVALANLNPDLGLKAPYLTYDVAYYPQMYPVRFLSIKSQASNVYTPTPKPNHPIEKVRFYGVTYSIPPNLVQPSGD